MYTHQMIRVRWGSAVTDGFLASNGVKQGGVLSPSLFTLYMDPLLKRLRDEAVGCHVGEAFCAGLGYADDLILLSPTRESLRRQLRLCAEYAENFKVTFNPSKSKVICVPSGHDSQTVPHGETPFHFMGGRIQFVAKDLHLGCLIGNVTAEDDVGRAVADFNKRVAMLRSHFFWLAPQAKYYLFKAYCMPLYGCPLWDFGCVDKFCTAWRKAIRALFGLHPRTHSALLPSICGDIDAKSQLLHRCLSFAKSLGRTSNSIVAACFENAKRGSRSAFGRSLTLLCQRLRCGHDALLSGTSVALTPRENHESLRQGGLIRDLLELKHDMVVLRRSDQIELNDIIFAIQFICTE